MTILDLFVDSFIRLSFHSNSHTSVIQKKVYDHNNVYNAEVVFVPV